jgi:hypothetical protein
MAIFRSTLLAIALEVKVVQLFPKSPPPPSTSTNRLSCPRVDIVKYLLLQEGTPNIFNIDSGRALPLFSYTCQYWSLDFFSFFTLFSGNNIFKISQVMIVKNSQLYKILLLLNVYFE